MAPRCLTTTSAIRTTATARRQAPRDQPGTSTWSSPVRPDLSFRIRQAWHRANADQAEGDQNEFLIVDYPLSIHRPTGTKTRHRRVFLLGGNAPIKEGRRPVTWATRSSSLLLRKHPDLADDLAPPQLEDARLGQQVLGPGLAEEADVQGSRSRPSRPPRDARE